MPPFKPHTVNAHELRSNENTPLHLAAGTGNVDIIKALFVSRADINARNMCVYRPVLACHTPPFCDPASRAVISGRRCILRQSKDVRVRSTPFFNTEPMPPPWASVSPCPRPLVVSGSLFIFAGSHA
jgi:ankyrin repeat protein